MEYVCETLYFSGAICIRHQDVLSPGHKHTHFHCCTFTLVREVSKLNICLLDHFYLLWETQRHFTSFVGRRVVHHDYFPLVTLAVQILIIKIIYFRLLSMFFLTSLESFTLHWKQESLCLNNTILFGFHLYTIESAKFFIYLLHLFVYFYIWVLFFWLLTYFTPIEIGLHEPFQK